MENVILEGNEQADSLLRRMARGDQRTWLTEELILTKGDTKEAIRVLDALERVIGNPLDFRECLRATFSARLDPIKLPNLCAAILGEILRGWDWKHERIGLDIGYENYGRTRLVVSEDAEACFSFFCKTFMQWRDGSLRGKWISLLHSHINAHFWGGEWHWRPEDLDKWILEDVHPEMLVVLAGARVRIGGAHLAERETRLGQAFKAHRRSTEAMNLALDYLNRLNGIEAVAGELCCRVRPHNLRGDTNTASPLTNHDKVEWVLESVDLARLKITFGQANTISLAASLVAMTKVQDVRDELVRVWLQNEKHPIRILIEASGPNGFSIKED